MGTLTVKPVAAGDQTMCQLVGGTSFSSGIGSMAIGNYEGGGWSASTCLTMRFPAVTIAQGQIISAATLYFTCTESDSATTVNAKIYANKIANAVAPASGAAAIALDLTTNVVEWNNIPAWTNTTVYSSPSLVSIIQEIVAQGGWVSGNALQIIIHDNSSTTNADRDFKSYVAPNSYPYLTITYGDNPVTFPKITLIR